MNSNPGELEPERVLALIDGQPRIDSLSGTRTTLARDVPAE